MGRPKKAESESPDTQVVQKKESVNKPVNHYKIKLIDNGHNRAKVELKQDFNDNGKMKPSYDDQGRKTVFFEKAIKECPISTVDADILNGQAENTKFLYLTSEDQEQVNSFNIKY